MSLPNNTCRGHCGAPSAHVPVATRCVTTSDNNTRPKQFYTVGTEIASFSEPLDWFEWNGWGGNKKVSALTSQHPAPLLTETLVASFFFLEDEKIMATTWADPAKVGGPDRGPLGPLQSISFNVSECVTMTRKWPLQPNNGRLLTGSMCAQSASFINPKCVALLRVH